MARDYWFQFGSGNPSTKTGLNPTFIFFINSAGATISPPAITETYTGTGLYKVNYNATQTIAFVMDGATTGLVTSDRYITGVFDAQDQFGVTLNAVNATLLAIGQTLTAIGTAQSGLGTTLVAQGSTLVGIGTTQIAMGSTLVGIGTTQVALGSTVIGIGTTQIALGATVVNNGNLIAALGSSFGAVSTLLGDNSSSYGTTAVPTTVFGFLKRSREFWEGDQVYSKASGILDFFAKGTSTMLVEKTVVDTTTSTTKT